MDRTDSLAVSRGASERPRPRVVVIGGGFGGLNAAKRLAQKADVDITLIDRENHHLFQPLLYQIATAALSAGSIAVPIRSVLSKSPATQVLLAEAIDADLERKALKLEDGSELPYDYLVIAAGAKTHYFGNDQWAEHAYGLKDLRDAIRIRERILLGFEAAEREDDPEKRRRLLSFVVIGGGPTGVEMAGAIAELGRMVLARDYHRVRPSEVRVTLLEMADRILLPFDPSLSERSARSLEELGVTVRTSTRVTDVREGEVILGDEVLPASTVVWATGVRAVSFAEKLGTPTDRTGRLLVDHTCNLPGHPEVFAVGDIAAFVPPGEEAALPGLAPVAIQQGRYVADTIRRDLAGKQRRPFEYVDKGIMATIGRSRAVVEAGRIKITGFIAWIMWSVVHVLYLVGFRNRLLVMFEWVWQYLTFKRGARLITARHVLEPRREGEPSLAAAEASALRRLPPGERAGAHDDGRRPESEPQLERR